MLTLAALVILLTVAVVTFLVEGVEGLKGLYFEIKDTYREVLYRVRGR